MCTSEGLLVWANSTRLVNWRAAGVPVTTLRYYERVGLVHPTTRADNQYRLYTGHTLQLLRFI